jgi:hypothetical protein
MANCPAVPKNSATFQSFLQTDLKKIIRSSVKRLETKKSSGFFDVFGTDDRLPIISNIISSSVLRSGR